MLSKTLRFGIVCAFLGAFYGATDFSSKFKAAIEAIFLATLVVFAHLLLFLAEIKKRREKNDTV